MSAVHGAEEFAALAQRLKDAGETGLRRRMYKAISDAAAPLAAKIKDPAYLDPYMPNRYAAILGPDLKVTTYKRATGPSPSIRVIAESPRPRNRQVVKLNEGSIRHPVFANDLIPRRDWEWKTQYKGMIPGFFSDAVAETGPQVRDACAAALHDTAQQIAGK